MQFHDDLFLTLHHMDPKARVLLCSFSTNDLGDQEVVYRKLSMAGFHKEAYTILMMDEIDFGLFLLNLPEPQKN